VEPSFEIETMSIETRSTSVARPLTRRLQPPLPVVVQVIVPEVPSSACPRGLDHGSGDLRALDRAVEGSSTTWKLTSTRPV
jgi:hypothetical protein